MSRGSRGSLVLALVLFVSVVSMGHVTADTNPPIISDLRWVPRYAIIGTAASVPVTIYANVTDPDVNRG